MTGLRIDVIVRHVIELGFVALIASSCRRQAAP